MNGTVSARVPTDGTAPAAGHEPGGPAQALALSTCTSFSAKTCPQAAQDQASASQDPDIGDAVVADKLGAMPSSSPWSRVRHWLAYALRMLAGPSSPSPATGRPALRLPDDSRVLGFREFTLPRPAQSDAPARMRMDADAADTRSSLRSEDAP